MLDTNGIIKAIKSYMQLEKEAGMDEYIFQGILTRHTSGPKDTPESLESLKGEVSKCVSCDLHTTRRNVVFGSGNPKARLMFVGEAPGEDEDLQGLPFVGRAGQLLTKIIEAMGLKRQDVYIANILKCRPPKNRAPLPPEISACADNLRRQIDLIKPKVICTLGKFASQTLLKTETPITALRGKFQEYPAFDLTSGGIPPERDRRRDNGIKVMPTFHPAYLLRNPQDKKLVWEDMKNIRKEIAK
ncbi:MAG: uracil-DNA glycosylase [Candidatus Omnitrophota bacterium]|nr:uracil-DNA glycosylase [Candidatus Omnitrophota bacterium]